MTPHVRPYLALSAILVLVLAACVPPLPTPAPTAAPGPTREPLGAEGPGEFTSDDFALSYPEGWRTAACQNSRAQLGQAHDLDATPLLCLEADEGPAYCTVLFKDTSGSAGIQAAYDRIYRDQAQSYLWQIDSERPFTIAERRAIEVTYRKPHGEPWYKVRDTWLLSGSGAYILTCHTYSNSFRVIDGVEKELFDIYAPVFDAILGGFKLLREAPEQGEMTPQPTSGARESTTETSTQVPEEGLSVGSLPAALADARCTFTTTGNDPIASWYWLRDPRYAAAGRWSCTGLPVDQDLPVTLMTLVTNGADGGSGYSAPAVVLAGDPSSTDPAKMQVYLQNPLTEQDPANSHGAGYFTTGYLVIPAAQIGPDGAVQIVVARLPPDPHHVAINGQTLRLDTPRRAAAFRAEGDLIQGWTWLRDPAGAAFGEWRFAGLNPTAPTVLVLDLLVTDSSDRGAGYSALVEISASGPQGEMVTQVNHVRAQNPLFQQAPDDASGNGYRAFGSLALDPAQLPPSGELVVRLARASADDRHVAVNAESVQVVQPGATVTSEEIATTTPGDALGPTPDRPQDQASCEALGGRWGRIGLAPREACNLPTTDAGETCSDSDECESLCLADLTEEQKSQVNRGDLWLRTTGQCAAWQSLAGCLAPVENGVVSSILCID